MRIARTGAIVVATACSMIIGCPNLPGMGEGEGEGDCTGDFAIDVSDGLTPTFTWDGDAAGLAVALAEDGSQRMWVLSQAATNPFSSPVTYGQVPTGAMEAEGAAQDLVAGTAYTITITAGNGTDASCAEFTPDGVGGDAG